MKKLTKVLAAIMLTTTAFFAAGCTKPDEPNDPNNGGNNDDVNLNGHEYVDLGLPSGTLWATCNVGANAPEEYGDYIAWGETQPKDTIYEWSTYKYCNGDYNLSKYCNDSIFGYHGFTDNLTVLLPEDDAATVNWGSGWCMPTYYQLEELCYYTSNTWTTQNGVNGRLFTATNGNSLFLPAAGYRDIFFCDDGREGVYWSSSLFDDDPCSAWRLDFISDKCFVSGSDGYYRVYGHSVRPVRSAR